MAIYHIDSTAGFYLVEAHDVADAQAQAYYLIGHRAFPKVIGLASADLIARWEATVGPIKSHAVAAAAPERQLSLALTRKIDVAMPAQSLIAPLDQVAA